MLVVCFFVSLFVCLFACLYINFGGLNPSPKKLRPMKHGTTWLWFNRWEMAAYRILALDQKNRNKSRPLLWTKIRHFSSGEFFSKYRKKTFWTKTIENHQVLHLLLVSGVNLAAFIGQICYFFLLSHHIIVTMWFQRSVTLHEWGQWLAEVRNAKIWGTSKKEPSLGLRN